MPSLVYPSADLWTNLERTMFHAVIVILEAAALTVAVVVRQQLVAQQEEVAQDLKCAFDAANIERDKALIAQEKAETAVANSDADRKAADDALQKSKTTEAARLEIEE